MEGGLASTGVCIADQLDTTLPLSQEPRGPHCLDTRRRLLQGAGLEVPSCRVSSGLILGFRGAGKRLNRLLAGSCELALSPGPFFSCSEIKGLKGLVLSRKPLCPSLSKS